MQTTESNSAHISERKTLYPLLFSVFVTVTGVGVVVPLLPIYANDLGASGLYIGLIFGAFSFSRVVFLPIFGRISDLRGRKRFILSGFLLYSLISIAYVLSSGVAALIGIRFFHGVASAMLMPVIQAYVGDITPTGQEGRIMGLFSMFTLFGLSIGPVMGGFVKDSLGLNASFAVMGSMALLGFFLSWLLLPPTSHEQAVRTRSRPAPWRILIKDPTLISLGAFRFAFVMGIGVIWGFLPLYADRTLNGSGSAVGLLITFGVLVSGSLNAPMGILADRFNRRLMVAVGGLISAGAIMSLGWADSYLRMALATATFGLGGGTAMPALMAIATRRGNDSDAMGSVMALMTIAHSLGMLAGALMGGLLMDMIELRYAFPAGAGVLVAATFTFLMGTRHMRPLDTGRRPAVNTVDAAPEYR